MVEDENVLPVRVSDLLWSTPWEREQPLYLILAALTQVLALLLLRYRWQLVCSTRIVLAFLQVAEIMVIDTGQSLHRSCGGSWIV